MSIAYEQQASAALVQLDLAVAEQQLDQAAQQAAASGWSYTHFLGYLLDAELRFRHEKTVRLNLQFANLWKRQGTASAVPQNALKIKGFSP